jgi:hypothetical protein
MKELLAVLRDIATGALPILAVPGFLVFVFSRKHAAKKS